MLTGQRVRLRAMEPADAESLWRWNSDPDVIRWLDTEHPESLAHTLHRAAERERNSYEQILLMIETLAEGRLIGVVCLRDARPEHGRAELDVYLGEKEFWGRGHGTDAVRVICRYGFDQMRLHSVALWVAAGNTRAIRAFEKVGFVQDGRHREAFRRDGAWHDLVLMSLLEHEIRPAGR
ncbi:GNAT family N-acetyltransferase [Streptomyces marincola]|uniref:GNAT family N-acetyltransferase n=1 Tax=Streptomyces marincola TaxID=2878388 RepID=UPI001CF3B6DE|nr:GNAT family protein [Streptomyces marincola]UCM90917.1 GNAT family N-acetyltransferase [Streptomyces marincola]